MNDTLTNTILNYDMDAVVDAYAVSADVPLSLAKEQERELKRYLAMRASRPAERLGMAGPIDDLWHYFILATKEYSDFCEVAGGFIHHRPLALDTVGTAGNGAYARTLAAYESAYGETAPPEHWPTLDVLVAMGSGADCGRCT